MVIFWPLFNKFGYPMDLKTCILLSYSGLRGAVGLALALICERKFESDPELAPIGKIILFHTSFIVILTLVINGTTTGALVKALGVSAENATTKSIIMDFLFDLDE
jgi:hypothetical protein